MCLINGHGGCSSLQVDRWTTSQISRQLSQQSLTSHSTHNKSFRRRVFPANHLAMVLTKQTYSDLDKYKKPQKLNLTKPNKTKLTLVQLPLRHPARKRIGPTLTKNHSSRSPHWGLSLQLAWFEGRQSLDDVLHLNSLNDLCNDNSTINMVTSIIIIIIYWLEGEPD